MIGHCQNIFQNLYSNVKIVHSQCKRSQYNPAVVNCAARCWPHALDVPLWVFFSNLSLQQEFSEFKLKHFSSNVNCQNNKPVHTLHNSDITFSNFE